MDLAVCHWIVSVFHSCSHHAVVPAGADPALPSEGQQKHKLPRPAAGEHTLSFSSGVS
ncbi:hypothetical protein M9458_020819, partial [Cirrhinus mrigala]